MWPRLIRTKVVICIGATLILGGGGIIALSYREYVNQIDRIGHKSLDEAREAFASAEADDVKMLKATLETLMSNDAITTPFARRDRAALAAVTAPMLAQMKAHYGITNWMFVEPEPSNKVFLRVHKPGEFGDTMDRPLHEEAIRTKTFAVGKELGKAGFILRVVLPVYDAQKKLLGYANLGEEIGGFIGRVQRQTGHQLAIVMRKQALDHNLWSATCKTLKIEDEWDRWPSFVLMGSTKKDASFAAFDGDLDAVPETGGVLGLRFANGRTTLRAIVPLLDDHKVRNGGIVLETDITDVYRHARTTAIMTIGVIFLLIIVMSLAMAFMMDRLVFRRIDRVIDKTTRFVGGDAASVIAVEGDDEVGKVETLLDQLRQLFVHTTLRLPQGE